MSLNRTKVEFIQTKKTAPFETVFLYKIIFLLTYSTIKMK